jgi:hypothetical protein
MNESSDGSSEMADVAPLSDFEDDDHREDAPWAGGFSADGGW